MKFHIKKREFIFVLILLLHCSLNHNSNRGHEKLFTLLQPSHTKITFNNKIIDKKEHSILLYSNYYGGGGVGIGDINNDGLQDIYFAGNLVGDKLYLNKGNLVFEDITEEAGIRDNGGWSSGVLFGDVNGDGWTDIYVTRELYDDNPELRRNKLYINNGDNTFTEKAAAYGLDDSERTRHATFIDYDKDGDLDLFLCNQPPNPGIYSPYYLKDVLSDKYSPRLYENTGNYFTDVTEQAGLLKPGYPNSVIAADFNGDGWVDLWIANDYEVRDFLYFNNGDGTFTDRLNETVPHISFSSMGIDAADINNDDWLDVMVVDMVVEDHYRRHRNMAGLSPESFREVTDNDGHHQYFTNTLFLNRGKGIFSEIALYSGVGSTDWSWSALFLDMDNDGWKDIFIANGLMRDIRDYDANNKFSAMVSNAIYQFLIDNPNTTDVKAWDIINLEKLLDITPSVKVMNYAFKNNRDLTFTKVSEDWGFSHKSFSNGAAYADLDNDGDLDIVVNNINDAAFIYKNNSEKTNNHYIRIKPIADNKSVSLLGTKIRIETNYGRQFFEISGVRGMYSTSEHIAHFGLGNASVVKIIMVEWADGRKTVLKNVQADREISVYYSKSDNDTVIRSSVNHPVFKEITRQTGINYRHVENEFDDYAVQSLLPYKLSELGPCLAVGDFNNDGLEDFFVGGAHGMPGQLFKQSENGSFTPVFSKCLLDDKIYEDAGATFFDADNDNDLDLYVVSGGNESGAGSSYQDRLYLNDGSGFYTRAEDRLPEITTSGSKVYPADFDRDGDQDLLITGRHTPWSYPVPTSTFILVNDGFQFVNATNTIAPGLLEIGMVNDARWVDIDNDSLADIVLAGEWMPVTIFLNKNRRFINVTDEYGLGEMTGWWFSIEAADMDNDGDVDLIAGNFGANSRYYGSPNAPIEVFYADFDNNGSKDIVMSYNYHGKKYPLRRKKDVARKMPLINYKFKTYASYAASDIIEIYGKNNLENALHYEANFFQSIYLENSGHQRFKIHILPAKAQFSSINDILTGDFNKDSFQDILIVGNMYSIEKRTPRNDACIGLLLAGDGKGNFESVEYTKSGFFIPCDAKSMSKITINGRKAILTVCNKDSLRAFTMINP